jgi:putative cell wall-binding protein/alpha-tubulin suppressor-like RCC1 family protein
MKTHRSFRLIVTFLVLVSAVLAVDIAGLSTAPRVAAVSDWKNSDVTAVAVGFDHTCAIETGVLYCWGGGTLGQLGYLEPRVGFRIPPPTDQSKAIKVASEPVAGFTNTSVAAVVTGQYTTCAIENKAAYCWGNNSSGQLGNGRVETQRNTAVKVSATNGFANNNVAAISHSGLNGCVLEGGVVYCWGSNNGGNVGDGTLISKTAPHKVVDNDGFVNNNVTAIAAGLTSCAVAGGELFCWGDGRHGQIGNGTTTEQNPRPRKVSSVSGGFQNSAVVSVSVTGINVCATRLENGNPVMYCWGRGELGNHGTGDTQANVTRPRKVVPVAGGFTNSQVSSSHVGNASCAVDLGIVYCFGTNNSGQVGDGTTTRPLSATRVVPSNGLLNAGAVTMVAARFDHTCAIENKVVFCWGQAFNGRLGNGETSGTYSSAVSAASLPGAPVISGATAGTTTAAVTVAAGPGGVPTSYTVTASPGGATCTITPPETSCELTGLTEGSTYTITATANSDQGTSPPSAPVELTTGVPAAPGPPTVVPGDEELHVTVSATTSGGTPSGYIMTAVDDEGNEHTCTITPPETSCTIAGLDNGTEYTVTTAAINNAGLSPASGGTSAVPGPPNPPLAPVLEVGDGSLTVTVSPAPTGGTASHYTVYVQPGGHSCTVTPPATSCTFTGLINGTTYTATTTATNPVGTSNPSPSTSALVDILPNPATPSVTLSTEEDDGANVTISATVTVSALTPGGTITNQTVYIEPGGFTCEVEHPNTSCTIEGLSSNTQYTVTSSAVNGLSTPVVSPSYVFDASLPGEPTLSATAIATGSATLSVTPSSGGGPVSYFVVYSGNSTCTVTPPETSCELTGLAGGLNNVSVSAINPLGSATSSVLVVDLSPPGPPSITDVIPGNSSATVSVSPPTTGGVPSSYVVTFMPGNHTCEIDVPATTCSVDGLSNGITYTVTASAVNPYGPSAPSATSSVLVDVPPIALAPTVEVASGGVTVSGTVDPAGGSASSYTFIVEPGPLSCTAEAPDTQCFIPLVTNGAYTVTSTVTNSAHTSAPSSPTQFGYFAPAPPVAQSVMIGLGQVTVSVVPGTGASTGPTTFITVYVGPGSCVVTPPDTSCTITGLAGGQIYDVTASATNGVGTTPSTSGLQAALLPPNAPPPPFVLLDSNTSATVIVAPPLDGQLPTSYTVTATSSAGVLQTCTVIVPDDACYMTGLTGGQLYSFSVVAHNAYGPSDPGDPTLTLLQEPTEPGPPLVVPGNGRAQVTVVPGVGGGPATDYIVTAEPGPFSCDQPIRAPSLTCTISGLTNGVAYTFTVIAANGVGSSTASAGTEATPRAPVSAPALVDRVARVFGSDRFATSVAVSLEFAVVGAPAVYVASGVSLADAMVAGSYAAEDGGSVLFVERDRVPAGVLGELRRLAPREVVVVGGHQVVAPSVEQSLVAAGFRVRRVAGADRYATAVALSKRGYASTVSTVYVASGVAFADAMPAGVLAAIDDGPVLLVTPGGVPAVTAAELVRLRPERIVIVGGPAEVGAAVEASLRSYAARVVRVSGVDRYETAVALSQSRFDPGVPAVFVMSGDRFPDALAAVAPAGRLGGPILLSSPTCVPASVRAEIGRLQPGRIIIIGGGAVLGSGIDALATC